MNDIMQRAELWGALCFTMIMAYLFLVCVINFALAGKDTDGAEK